MRNTSISFERWMSRFLLAYVVFDLLFVGLASLVLHFTFRNLLQSFALIFVCGVIASILTYWTREAYDKPGLCALRLALSFAVYLLLFMSTLLVSAARSGLIPRASIVPDFISLICPGSAIAAVAVYLSARSKLKNIHGQGAN